MLIRKLTGSLPKNSLAKPAINIILAKSDSNFAVNSLNLLCSFSLIDFSIPFGFENVKRKAEQVMQDFNQGMAVRLED
ncbi:MAG: hypothetical protein KJ902_00750 [Candidatus Omnitrophica bacterium]|nr:hypothetical protein [Candidatus Omnitrophota bacterium]